MCYHLKTLEPKRTLHPFCLYCLLPLMLFSRIFIFYFCIQPKPKQHTHSHFWRFCLSANDRGYERNKIEWELKRLRMIDNVYQFIYYCYFFCRFDFSRQSDIPFIVAHFRRRISVFCRNNHCSNVTIMNVYKPVVFHSYMHDMTIDGIDRSRKWEWKRAVKTTKNNTYYKLFLFYFI